MKLRLSSKVRREIRYYREPMGSGGEAPECGPSQPRNQTTVVRRAFQYPGRDRGASGYTAGKLSTRLDGSSTSV